MDIPQNIETKYWHMVKIAIPPLILQWTTDFLIRFWPSGFRWHRMHETRLRSLRTQLEFSFILYPLTNFNNTKQHFCSISFARSDLVRTKRWICCAAPHNKLHLFEGWSPSPFFYLPKSGAAIYLHIFSIDLVCKYFKSIYSEQTLDAATER